MVNFEHLKPKKNQDLNQAIQIKGIYIQTLNQNIKVKCNTSNIWIRLSMFIQNYNITI